MLPQGDPYMHPRGNSPKPAERPRALTRFRYAGFVSVIAVPVESPSGSWFADDWYE